MVRMILRVNAPLYEKSLVSTKINTLITSSFALLPLVHDKALLFQVLVSVIYSLYLYVCMYIYIPAYEQRRDKQMERGWEKKITVFRYPKFIDFTIFVI